VSGSIHLPLEDGTLPAPWWAWAIRRSSAIEPASVIPRLCDTGRARHPVLDWNAMLSFRRPTLKEGGAHSTMDHLQPRRNR
jgi:hypothetical protein